VDSKLMFSFNLPTK